MPRVRFFHWNADEAKPGIKKLRAAGYSVSYKVPGPGFMGEIRKQKPIAIVIDLGRLPSQGRDLGMAVRDSKSTRHLPIVFVGGDPEKVERFKKQILVNAPSGFEQTLGDLPEGVTLRRQARGRYDLAIWFPKSAKDLSARVKQVGRLADKDGLWIAWPKQASGIPTDLTQTVVRKTGLASGLVDYKVCAIDETWSGLKFARRKSK
jgi:hypothetical protein